MKYTATQVVPNPASYDKFETYKVVGPSDEVDVMAADGIPALNTPLSRGSRWRVKGYHIVRLRASEWLVYVSYGYTSDPAPSLLTRLFARLGL